jgi:hypothetical protein
MVDKRETIGRKLQPIVTKSQESKKAVLQIDISEYYSSGNIIIIWANPA